MFGKGQKCPLLDQYCYWHSMGTNDETDRFGIYILSIFPIQESNFKLEEVRFTQIGDKKWKPRQERRF